MTFVRLMDVAVGGPLWNKVGPVLERGLRRHCRCDDGALACDCVRFFKWLPTLMDESTYIRRPSLLWKWKASGVLQLKRDYKWLFLVRNLNVHIISSGGEHGWMWTCEGYPPFSFPRKMWKAFLDIAMWVMFGGVTVGTAIWDIFSFLDIFDKKSSGSIREVGCIYLIRQSYSSSQGLS